MGYTYGNTFISGSLSKIVQSHPLRILLVFTLGEIEIGMQTRFRWYEKLIKLFAKWFLRAQDGWHSGPYLNMVDFVLLEMLPVAHFVCASRLLQHMIIKKNRGFQTHLCTLWIEELVSHTQLQSNPLWHFYPGGKGQLFWNIYLMTYKWANHKGIVMLKEMPL